jgi:hypothetical protein
MSFLLFIGACKKFETSKQFKMNSYVKSYFQFKTGSNWVYVLENDSSKKTVTAVQNYREGTMILDDLTAEFFEYDLQSSEDSLLKLRAISDDNNVNWANFLVKDTMFKIALQWYNNGSAFSVVDGTKDTLSVLETKTVNGMVYRNVLELAPYKKIYFKKVWVAQNIGIIQKQMKDGKVYMLKSYFLQ